MAYPPPPPPMGPPDRNFLWGVFQQVDTNRSGQVDAAELQNALTKGSWTPFKPETVRLMIGMFDKDNSGTISFNEFESLWKYIGDWQATFYGADTDRSGLISKAELQRCMTAGGYRLSDRLYDSIIRRMSRRGQLTFGDFVHVCLLLQTLTSAFKAKDRSGRGTIQLGYEDFLALTTDNVLRMTMTRQG